jgi:hypothetical protein
MNMAETPRTFILDITGLPGAQIAGERRITVDAAQTEEVTLPVRVPVNAGKPGSSNQLFFEVSSEDDTGLKLREKTTFLFPR